MPQIIPYSAFRHTALALFISVVLTGCTTQEFRKTDALAEQDLRDAKQLHDRTHTIPVSSPLVWLDTPWVDPKPIRVSAQAQKMALPPCSLTLNISDALSLYEFGQSITRSCGIPVVITPDAMNAGAVSGVTGGTTRVMQGTLPRPNENGRPTLASIGSIASTSSSPSSSTTRLVSDISWENSPLGGLLDQVTSRMGINWNYENERITLYYLDTRTYRLNVLNAETAMNANLTGSSNSSTGGDNSSNSGSQESGQSTTVKLESNIYSDIAASVKAIVSPAGTWHLSGSTAELVVTDVPLVLDRIERYINQLNVRMNKMVRLSVKIYSVKRSSQSQSALDWSVVAGQLDRFGMTLTGSPTSTTPISLTGFSVLDGKFAGTSALFRALESQGKVAVVMDKQDTTTNLAATSFQIADQMVYLRKQSTTTSDTYATTSIEDGNYTTGTQLTLIPDIRDEGDIQLQVNFNHSDPAQLRKIESDDGTTKMEMPYTTIRSLSDRVNLKPGQTLVVSGYNARNLSTTREGAFAPDFTAAGGGKTSELDDVTLIIAITPELL